MGVNTPKPALGIVEGASDTKYYVILWKLYHPMATDFNYESFLCKLFGHAL